jgi:hypothetical protein
LTNRFRRKGIRAISPLRYQPVSDRYAIQGIDPCFDTPEAIVAKNFLDVRACDFVLAYFPLPPEVAELDAIIERMSNLSEIVASIVGPLDEDAEAIKEDAETLRRIARRGLLRTLGTIGEVSWAHALQKPCAVVTDDPLIREHAFTSVQPDWKLSTLDDAERLIVSLFADYVQ